MRMSDGEGLNPFGTGQCLTTLLSDVIVQFIDRLNPFGTGQCLTTAFIWTNEAESACLNPFGTGQCLTTGSRTKQCQTVRSLNPFGTGQCLTTAVGSSSLVRQGLPKPLPNFFRDSESWVLIWLNFEQVLTFHLHIKRSKT